MKKMLILAAAAVLPFISTNLIHAQDPAPADCKQTIEKSCTTCHGTGKICKKLESPDTNWAIVVYNMGKKGNLSQETQDGVLKCFTSPAETTKLLCEKK